MNIGSIRPQTATASQTIFTKGRTRRAHGPSAAPSAAPFANPAALPTPTTAMPILTASASGAPAAPASPSLGSLAFVARLDVTKS